MHTLKIFMADVFACMCCMFICWVHLCVHVWLVVSYVYVLLIAWMIVRFRFGCLLFGIYCMYALHICCKFSVCICIVELQFEWLIVAYLLGACVFFFACLVYVFSWHGRTWHIHLHILFIVPCWNIVFTNTNEMEKYRQNTIMSHWWRQKSLCVRVCVQAYPCRHTH